MKALILQSYTNLVYKDMPDPEPKVNKVLIRVMECGICGSDVHGWILPSTQHPAPSTQHPELIQTSLITI